MDLIGIPTNAFLYAPSTTDPNGRVPDLVVERTLANEGYQFICGVDEAGRGPLAGPVVCSAVILDPENIPSGLQDSKKLAKETRLELYNQICATSAVSVALASAITIDKMNIRAATLHKMATAIQRLPAKADAALIDGNALPPASHIHMWPMVKGDGRSASIAAASIVAKTVRDAVMEQADIYWPEYGFAKHKGYPTAAHRKALAELGPCPIHRQSFAPVRAAVEDRYRT
ncbi:MAG: ribonuclease HII [Pseudomonadota bacterium]